MQKSLFKNETKISYTLRSSKRSKRLRIAISADGEVRVTKPVWASALRVEPFLWQKFDWILAKIIDLRQRPQKLLQHFSVKEFKDNKERARVLAIARLAHFNQFYNLEVNRVSIKNQKTRWGSCSGRGNLSFNYKIFFLPPELQDYLVVHELCHIREMNHSSKFWTLVAEQVPDHKLRRAQMKLY